MHDSYKKIVFWIEAFLISFACTVKFSRPLIKGDFPERVDYYTAQIYALLGEYHFLSIPIVIMAYVLLLYCDKLIATKTKKTDYALPIFFSFCLFMGRSYQEIGNWQYCFGGVVNTVRFLLAMVGMSVLLQRLLFLLVRAYEKLSGSIWRCKFTEWLFGRKTFVRTMSILFLCWLPIIILSYPGNLCYDVIGQLEQVIGEAEYSAHHPLLHTLLAGGLVKLGGSLFGSYEVGLFIYILVQALMLASALTGTIWWLTKQEFAGKKVSHPIMLVILGIYVLAPMYSNVASTALKDVPFVALFIWYMIMLAEVCQHRQVIKNWKFSTVFVLVQVLVALLRNNGFYVILLTGAALAVIWWKGADKKTRLLQLVILFLAPVLLSKILNASLIIGLSAKEGSTAEIFSLPFQQTARYLQFYREELTIEQKQAIEAVLGDVDVVAADYDPKIADPVKMHFYEQEEVTTKEIVDYFAVWGQGFFKHPAVYLEGFFAHVYGWFDPQASNAVRYEASYEKIPGEGLFANADKIVLFLYRFAERITPIGMLQNVGVYTWGLLVLIPYAMTKNRKRAVLLIPLFISLLICMASPCFYLHPRYAFPYMFTLPFLYGFMERSRE